jgi:hypothetical protein
LYHYLHYSIIPSYQQKLREIAHNHANEINT